MSLLQKMPSEEGWKHQTWPARQKMRFFKVKDNDTTIQPGEKEGQTDVSSALKMFYDHYRGFWEKLIFRFSITTLTTFLSFLYRNAIIGLKKSKIQDFLKNRCSGRKTFLGPN